MASGEHMLYFAGSQTCVANSILNEMVHDPLDTGEIQRDNESQFPVQEVQAEENFQESSRTRTNTQAQR